MFYPLQWEPDEAVEKLCYAPEIRTEYEAAEKPSRYSFILLLDANN